LAGKGGTPLGGRKRPREWVVPTGGREKKKTIEGKKELKAYSWGGREMIEHSP